MNLKIQQYQINANDTDTNTDTELCKLVVSEGHDQWEPDTKG